MKLIITFNHRDGLTLIIINRLAVAIIIVVKTTDLKQHPHFTIITKTLKIRSPNERSQNPKINEECNLSKISFNGLQIHTQSANNKRIVSLSNM